MTIANRVSKLTPLFIISAIVFLLVAKAEKLIKKTSNAKVNFCIFLQQIILKQVVIYNPDIL